MCPIIISVIRALNDKNIKIHVSLLQEITNLNDDHIM